MNVPMMARLLLHAIELREFLRSNAKLKISDTRTYHGIGLGSKAVPNLELERLEIKETIDTWKKKSFIKMQPKITPFNNERCKKSWNLTPKEKKHDKWQRVTIILGHWKVSSVSWQLWQFPSTWYPPNCKTKNSKRCDFCRQTSEENHDNCLVILGFCQEVVTGCNASTSCWIIITTIREHELSLDRRETGSFYPPDEVLLQ